MNLQQGPAESLGNGRREGMEEEREDRSLRTICYRAEDETGETGVQVKKESGVSLLDSMAQPLGSQAEQFMQEEGVFMLVLGYPASLDPK